MATLGERTGYSLRYLQMHDYQIRENAACSACGGGLLRVRSGSAKSDRGCTWRRYREDGEFRVDAGRGGVAGGAGAGAFGTGWVADAGGIGVAEARQEYGGFGGGQFDPAEGPCAGASGCDRSG